MSELRSRHPLGKATRALGLAAALLFLPLASTGAELDAESVIREADARYDGDSSLASFTMVLIDRRERQRVRNLRIYSKDYEDDSKTLSVFETPADIRGTTYLNFDWADPDRDDDSWLYLPSLQRVKRIATSDTSDSFLGSDFTYADINGIEVDWYQYEFVNESEMVDGVECWVIDITPRPEFREKAEDATGYQRLRAWISKDNFIQLRGQAWELRGNRIKYFSASDIEQVDGIWTIGRMQAVSTRNGNQLHSSVLQLNDIEYNLDLDDGMFTTEAMQRSLD